MEYIMNCYQDLKQSELSISRDNDGRIIGKFRFDNRLPLFQGHFPGNPILPGIFQIEMVRYCLEKYLKTSLHLSMVRKTKFSSLIHPDVVVSVEITINQHEADLWNVKALVKAADVIAGKANLTLKRRRLV
jgi:3-hydroxyacyl-[acyl-carrier-protein] dehydratase